MHVSGKTERIRRALRNQDLRSSIRATYQKVLFLAVHFMYSIIQNIFSFYALWVLHSPLLKRIRPRIHHR
jgi:hypothetical protein